MAKWQEPACRVRNDPAWQGQKLQAYEDTQWQVLHAPCSGVTACLTGWAEQIWRGGESMKGSICVYIYVYIHTYIYIYIYTERERKKGRDIEKTVNHML